MLDTVILNLPHGHFMILTGNRFGYEMRARLSDGRPLRRWVANPEPRDKRTGKYYPRLTLTQRGMELTLKIEFSAPKMLYGNNLDEISESDFPAVIRTLKDRLYEWGVMVRNEDILNNAPVSGFHASKNIPLTDGYTATLAIAELGKIGLTQKLDLDHKNFRNDGHALQYYSNSHALVMYDKIADMGKPPKRAIDKDSTPRQLSLFQEIMKQPVPPEILRLEARLPKKQKMNSMLAKLGYPANPTFSDIFKRDVCQKVLQYYWQEMILKKNAFIFDMGSTEYTLIGILDGWQQKKYKEAVYLMGLRHLCRELGVRKFRAILKAKRPKADWARIAKDMHIFCDPLFRRHPHGFVKDITTALERFTAYRYKSG